jgi:hypothetical protein
MTPTEQLFLAFVVVAFIGFAALAAFLSLSDHLYDKRQRQPHAIGAKAAAAHPDAKPA